MEIHIGNRVAEVELISKEGNNVVLNIDGVRTEVNIVMAENGVCSILKDGKSYNTELTHSKSGSLYHVNSHYSTYNVEIVDNQTKYLRLRQKDEAKQLDRVISPMPGKVVNIPVKEGQMMKPGDTVAVIEAMKMQSNYKVTSDCRIRKILVKEGDAITNGQELILLDL
jgi:biotin carboxyl carrier protein